MPDKNIVPAILALADGAVFYGESCGASITATGEVVFNTGMTGYQEILTDPSYCRQLVTMTCPHIGNVGVNQDDMEANRPYVAGLIVREISPVVSSWRAEQSLPDYLRQHNLPGITEINTRALVRYIRSKGAMMATLSTEGGYSADDLVDIARTATPMTGLDLAKEVSCSEPYQWNTGVKPEWKTEEMVSNAEAKHHVVAYDFGIKHNIMRLLVEAGCHITVVPANTPADEVIALKPDGIFLSNGPGDPSAVTYAVEAVRQLVETGRPIFGICLGHQILGLALGGKTHKLKFGHRGSNQPVQDNSTGQVTITSHNHGFALSPGSLPDNDVEITHLNLNDGCIEGLRHKMKPIFSIQYHPEASPGPHDAFGFFGQFVELIENQAAKN